MSSGSVIVRPFTITCMLQRIYNQRALSRVLCGLVFVALCNGATVWAFCPHLRSASHNCLNQHSVSHNHDSSAIGSFEKSCSYCAMHSELPIALLSWL